MNIEQRNYTACMGLVNSLVGAFETAGGAAAAGASPVVGGLVTLDGITRFGAGMATFATGEVRQSLLAEMAQKVGIDSFTHRFCSTESAD